MRQFLGSIRNQLLLIVVLCELVAAATLFVGTRPPDAIQPIDPVVVKLLQRTLEGAPVERQLAAIKAQDDLLHQVNDLTRSLARVVGAIGFLVLIVAWRAHIKEKEPAQRTEQESS